MSKLNSCLDRLLLAGTKVGDNHSTVRAIRSSNVLCLSAIFNTFILGTMFYCLREEHLFMIGTYVALIYAFTYLLNVIGYRNLARTLFIICGNLFVFYFSNIFRGETLIQLSFFSLCLLPFMVFSWNERRLYFLCLFPITLMLIGEFNSWSSFSHYSLPFDLKWVRLFCVVATIQQFLTSFIHYLKQSVKFETESLENLKQLEVEHAKQIYLQKLSSLGEMAAGVSHEINNPLMVITGKVHFIKRDLRNKLAADDVCFSHLQKMETMVERIVRIIEALRKFSRNAELDPLEEIEVDQIIDMTLDLCQQRFSASNIALDLKLEPRLKMLCRPTEISQVLLNLLNNSFDAVKDSEAPKVSISTTLREQMVEILIEDNGHGIHANIEDKIMQPFFTTKDIGKGTGLGLSISKGIIENHKGQLILLKDRGHTCFQILLPIHDAE